MSNELERELLSYDQFEREQRSQETQELLKLKKHNSLAAWAAMTKEVLLVPPLFLLDSAESGGIRWGEIWQEGLLIFSFQCILSPAEFGQSGIETGMVPGLAKQNDSGIRLFVWHMPMSGTYHLYHITVASA
jgi:hypothetical protein